MYVCVKVSLTHVRQLRAYTSQRALHSAQADYSRRRPGQNYNYQSHNSYGGRGAYGRGEFRSRGLEEQPWGKWGPGGRQTVVTQGEAPFRRRAKAYYPAAYGMHHQTRRAKSREAWH